MTKPLHTVLSDEEVTTLKNYKQSGYKTVRIKAEALLLLNLGMDHQGTGSFVDRTASTIKTWQRDFNKTRLASVFTLKANNSNASKLDPEQREEINRILAAPPSSVGLVGEFWTVPNLKDWVWSSFEVVYESDSSYHFLLTHAGLSFRYPQTYDKRRADQKVIEQRMAQIREEIAPMMGSADWMVFAADEVRVEQEAIVHKAWVHKNHPTTLKVDRQRQAQSYIGFLNNSSGQVDLMRLDWQNTENIIAALTTLVERYPGKKIAIVWDNAAWHRAKALRELLGENNRLGRVHLIWMPPYAPDYNPIERVWGEAKSAVSNRQRETFEQTCIAFETFIGSTKFGYRI